MVSQVLAASYDPTVNQKAKLITLYLSAGAVPGIAKDYTTPLPQYEFIPLI